jgi:hypothetical protein
MPKLLRLAQATFFVSLVIVFAGAVAPPSTVHLSLIPWDKAQHFIAFWGLTGLALAAFPKRNMYVIGALMSGFGALIEVVQGLPFVNRDEDFFDWVADTLAVIAAMLPMILPWWLGYFAAQKKNEK